MKVEQAYQRFRAANHGRLSDGRMLPYSLQNDEEVSVSTGLEMAMELLEQWKTAYEGVILMWDLIREDPKMEIESRFVKLLISKRCFLVQGMKQLARTDQDRGKEDRLAIIEKLEKYLVLGYEGPVDDVRGVEDRLTIALAQAKSPERAIARTPKSIEFPIRRASE
jgi:hypothetical protein